jgi:hypothetical protein
LLWAQLKHPLSVAVRRNESHSTIASGALHKQAVLILLKFGAIRRKVEAAAMPLERAKQLLAARAPDALGCFVGRCQVRRP